MSTPLPIRASWTSGYQITLAGATPCGRPFLCSFFLATRSSSPLGAVEKASLRLGLTFAFARHSGESRNPFSPLSLALRPYVLAPGRGRYGCRLIYPPHRFRTRARRSLPRVGIKSKNESNNQKWIPASAGMTVVFASRGFFNSPPWEGVKLDATIRAINRNYAFGPVVCWLGVAILQAAGVFLSLRTSQCYGVSSIHSSPEG